MAYRDDPDLVFLSKCTDDELDDLVSLLIYDKDGNTRLTEELTMTDAYKKYNPRHSLYWKEIAGEIQCFGANSLATLFRGGKGVLYKEILCDVCKKLKVSYNIDDDAETIENAMLLKVLSGALEKMTADERAEFAKVIGATNLNNLTPQTLLVASQAVFKVGGFKSYQITLIIVNQVVKIITNKGLKVATNAALVKWLSVFAGPIGLSISTGWTVMDIASPATRITIPAVFEIALLRKQIQERQG